MAKRLEDESRDTLSYRPDIRFIEPDIEEDLALPPPEPTQLEDVISERAKIKQLAKAVESLATATQARADEKAKGMWIKLDPVVDNVGVQAMRRMYPNANPTKISYEQYRNCKENMVQQGLDIGKKALVTEEDIAAAKDAAIASGGIATAVAKGTPAESAVEAAGAASAAGVGEVAAFNQLGGYNTPEAKNGGLRPELDRKSQVVEPLDIDDFQLNIIHMLINFIWKEFIKPILPIPPGVPGVPDKIAPESSMSMAKMLGDTNVLDQEKFAPETTSQPVSGSPTGSSSPTNPTGQPIDKSLADPQSVTGTAPGVGAKSPNQPESQTSTDPIGSDTTSLQPQDNVFAIQDCQTIQKAFERGAAFSVSEESVFAMMAPVLTPIRIQSGALIQQIDSSDRLSAEKTTKEKIADKDNPVAFAFGPENTDINLMNLGDSDENMESFATKLKGNWGIGEGTDIGSIFDSKCIPCGFRLNSLGEITLSANLGFKNPYSQFLSFWKEQLRSQMQQIMDLLSLFGGNNYIDICSLIKFLLDFMCVPDLQRMLSALMASMMRVSLEFGGILDLILMFVAPLITPILSGIVDMLQQYIAMVTKPLICIVNAIQAMIRKLDYNVLFKSIEPPKKPKTKNVSSASTSVTIKGKNPGLLGNTALIHSEANKDIGVTISGADLLANTPVGRAILRQKEKEQKAVEKAQIELDALKKNKPDPTNPAKIAAYDKQMKEAKSKYNGAVEERDLTEIQQMNATISRSTESMKSAFLDLANMLLEAAAAVEGYFNSIFDELKKIMGAQTAGHSDFGALLIKKMGIVQMVSMLSSLISFMMKGIECGDDEEAIPQIESILDGMTDKLVWTDEDGNIHIDESSSDMDQAVQEMVKALGVPPSQTPLESPLQPEPTAPAVIKLTGPGAAQNLQLKDQGQLPSTAEPSQKLKSLIEFTGDPVLDADIARATETLIKPSNISFRCPLQTTVKEAEQVNKWMKELENE